MSSISKYRCRLKLKINGGIGWTMIAQKECNDLIQRRKCLQRLWIFFHGLRVFFVRSLCARCICWPLVCQTTDACLLELLKWVSPWVHFIQKAFMSDQKTAPEKISSFGANMASHVNEAMQDALPAMNHMGHRVKDELHNLSESGKDVYADAMRKLEKEAHHVRVSTEHLIQQSPLNAVLIAAGTGALAALAVSWFMRSRQP